MTAMDCQARAIARHKERVQRKIERDRLSEECNRDEWEWIEREYQRELAQVNDGFPSLVVVHTSTFL